MADNSDEQLNGSQNACDQLKNSKPLIVFLFQSLALLIIILASIYNLSTDHPRSEVWISLLSTAFGILVPSPNYKKNIQDSS